VAAVAVRRVGSCLPTFRDSLAVAFQGSSWTAWPSLLVSNYQEGGLGILRRRWEDNIQLDLQTVGWGGVDWIDLAEVAGTCEGGDEPLGSIKCGNFLTSWGTVSFLGRTELHAASGYKWIRQYSKRYSLSGGYVVFRIE